MGAPDSPSTVICLEQSSTQYSLVSFTRLQAGREQPAEKGGSTSLAITGHPTACAPRAPQRSSHVTPWLASQLWRYLAVELAVMSSVAYPVRPGSLRGCAALARGPFLSMEAELMLPSTGENACAEPPRASSVYPYWVSS
jgi:hypothetical protein